MTCEIPYDPVMWASNENRFNRMLAVKVAERMRDINHRPTLVNPNNIPIGHDPVRTEYENWRLSQRQPRIDRFNAGVSVAFRAMRGTFKHHARPVNLSGIPDRPRSQSLVGTDRSGGRLHTAPPPSPPAITMTGKIL